MYGIGNMIPMVILVVLLRRRSQVAEITIRAKNLRTILQKVRDLHSHNVTLNVARGKLNASISGTDNKGRETNASISIKQEENND